MHLRALCTANTSGYASSPTRWTSLVLGRLTPALQQYVGVADQLRAVPWAVLVACNRLQQRGLIQSGVGDEKDRFRRVKGEF